MVNLKIIRRVNNSMVGNWSWSLEALPIAGADGARWAQESKVQGRLRLSLSLFERSPKVEGEMTLVAENNASRDLGRANLKAEGTRN